MSAVLTTVLFMVSFADGPAVLRFHAGPDYANYQLYQDSLEAKARWQLGVEAGIDNLVPNIGIRIHGTYLRYNAPVDLGPYAYVYTPVTMCAEFNMIPFLRTRVLGIHLITGLGIYLWKGLYNDAAIELPGGGKMEEKDLGFVGGLSVRVRPLNNLAVEALTRYHYLASADIYKYGYYDKDDKIWENGFSLKFLFP